MRKLTLKKGLLIALPMVLLITLLHVRENHEQWKEKHINMSTGGYYEL